MAVLITCRNEEDPIKNEGKIFPIISIWEFFQTSRAANSAVPGRIGPKFELMRDIMVVLLTCMNEEDPIKNEGARVLTKLYVLFQMLKGR